MRSLVQTLQFYLDDGSREKMHLRVALVAREFRSFLCVEAQIFLGFCQLENASRARSRDRLFLVVNAVSCA
jgi:hypothetical protein